MKLFERELVKNFRPKEWDYNGPKLLTRILEKQVCNTNLPNMTPEKCRGFRVFPPNEFYAVNWDTWYQLFDVRYTNRVLRATKNSSAVHLWTHAWRNAIIMKSIPKTAHEIIAEKNCPKAFQSSGLLTID